MIQVSGQSFIWYSLFENKDVSLTWCASTDAEKLKTPFRARYKISNLEFKPASKTSKEIISESTFALIDGV